MTTTLKDIGAVPLSEMEEGLHDAARGIPLYAKDGTIRAFAMVDEEDYRWASEHRWYRNTSGYAVRNGYKHEDSWTIFLHRGVLGLTGSDPRKTDHINRDKLDCRRANLRAVTHAQNHQNRASCGDRNTSSRFRGVSWNKPRRQWHAYGYLDGKLHFLGYFDDEEEAGKVAADFRKKHMPYSTN